VLVFEDFSSGGIRNLEGACDWVKVYNIKANNTGTIHNNNQIESTNGIIILWSIQCSIQLVYLFFVFYLSHKNWLHPITFVTQL